MHEITFDGKQYSKANVLAKELGYTADYIGQLCRAGKVDARLVGRAWFVSRESVLAHQAQRYEYQRTQQSTEVQLKNNEISKDIKLSRVAVPAAQSKHLRKHFYSHQTSDATLRISGKAKYEPDSSPLVPPVSKDSQTVIQVTLEGAVPVKISSEIGRSATLRPEAMPTVYMRGSLTVHDVPEAVSEVMSTDDGDVTTKPRVTHSSSMRLKTKPQSPHMVSQSVVTVAHLPEPEADHLPEVVELPIRPLEVIISRPVAISVVVASVVAVGLVMLESIVEVGIEDATQVRWQVANVSEFWR